MPRMPRTHWRWLRPVHVATAVLAFGLLGAAPASADQTLRIGMTASAVPTTTGQPTEGFEGLRFAGYPVFESLTMWDLRQTDRPPQLIPWLATSWTTDPTDRKKWIFTLRKGVKFHDGTDFNADAVVFNLARLFDEKSPQYDQDAAPQARTAVFLMDRWEKVDDYTVAIWAKDVATYFPEMLTSILYASPTQWEKSGRSWAAFGEHPAGTGAFRITHVDQSSIEMERNPDYWNQDRAAKLDHIILYPMPEATTRLAALRSGQVDWIEAPPPDSIPGLKDAGFNVVTSPFPHIWPYWLKEADNSPFKDVRVRQAINYAIDRDGLVALLNGTADPAVGFWKPSDPRFGNPKNHYTYDPARSRELLKEAGYPDGVHIKVLISTSGSGQMMPLPMNELIQQRAKDAGFDIEFEVVEVGQLFAMTHIPDNPEMKDIDAVNSSLTTSDMNWFFRSFFPPNWAHWNNPEAVALMEKYRTDFDTPNQDETLARIHEYLVDDAPWAWIVHDRNPRAFAPNVKGYTPAQSWFNDLTTIYMEE